MHLAEMRFEFSRAIWRQLTSRTKTKQREKQKKWWICDFWVWVQKSESLDFKCCQNEVWVDSFGPFKAYFTDLKGIEVQ